MTDRIRVLVVDDHSHVHLGIAAIIEVSKDLVLVAHASNGREALQLCAEYSPDIVLMDVIMPIMNGIDATRAIRDQFPNIKVLALSSFPDEEGVRAMLNAGAIGYLLKSSSVENLVHTIHTTAAGQSVFSPEVTQILINPRQSGTANEFGLTAREREILQLLVEGLNNKDIASRLSISYSTAKFHVRRIFGKLGVRSRIEAAALALDHKMNS